MQFRAGGKLVYKVGTAVYPTVEAAVTAALNKTPGLRLALGKMVDKLVAVGETISSSAVGRGVARVESAIARTEARVAERVGIGRVPETRAAAAQAERPASSAATQPLLHDQLASQQQMRETGRVIAGKGAEKTFRNAEKFAHEYGGMPGEWAKKSSTKAFTSDGRAFEMHWVENLRTGQRVQHKTKFTGALQ